jgi:hypothetical protein
MSVKVERYRETIMLRACLQTKKAVKAALASYLPPLYFPYVGRCLTATEKITRSQYSGVPQLMLIRIPLKSLKMILQICSFTPIY